MNDFGIIDRQLVHNRADSSQCSSHADQNGSLAFKRKIIKGCRDNFEQSCELLFRHGIRGEILFS